MPIPPHLRPQRPGIPRWLLIGVGGLVLVAGYFWYKNRGSSGASQTSSSAAPTLGETGYLSNVTDQSNNLPWEDTWPYNQLALPYNYSSKNAGQVAWNTNYMLPNQPQFIGSSVSPIVSGEPVSG